ncbi:MAG: carboxy terminal-processing peptidase [Saprospiraceae bacterium]|nr:carboxy terminal-processing peptidase [Saprospiraceae bacterium]
MVLRSSLILMIALIGLFLKSHQVSESDQTKKEFFTLQPVIKFMDRVHYEPKSLDDQLSHQVYDSFVKSIDPAKRFLTQEGINQLKPFVAQLDEQIANGTFEFFDLAEKLIGEGVDKAQQYYLKYVNQDLNIHSALDSLIINADDRNFSANDQELEAYWKKLLQYETIVKVHGMKVAKDDDAEMKSEAELIKEAKETISKNFDEWFKRLKSLRRSDRFEDYLNSITSSYDPHSNYFSPREKENFDLNMNNSYEGIGARLIPEGELTKVTEVIPGGPAWKQKELEANDFIIKVAQDGEEAKDVRGWREDDVIELIRGKKGTKVILTVRKADGREVNIAIIRDQVVLEEGRAKSLLIRTEAEGAEIGYIRLPKFYFEADGKPGCAADIATEVDKLVKEGAQGIILDLRNNGGGSLSEVVDMTGLFIDKGPVVQVKSRERKPYVLEDEDPAVQYQGPLIVLVNHFSASASEIIAAALQDYNRAIIVGSSSTFGKGTVQRFHQLDRFIVGNNDLKPLGEVKITTQKFYRVNGGSTQLKGVIPDIILPSPYNYVKAGEKELDTPLAWSEIEPVDHAQHVMVLPDRELLTHASKGRVANNEKFQLVEERAILLKEQHDEHMKYALSLEGYELEYDEREAQNDKFKNMYKSDRTLLVRNLESEIAHITEDESRKANNEDFMDGVKTDIYIEEVLNIMKDMLSQQ